MDMNLPKITFWRIILLLLIIVGVLYALPMTRGYVENAVHAIVGYIAGAHSWLQSQDFYINVISPNVAVVCFMLGAIIASVFLIALVKGWLNLIRFGRQQSDQLSGASTTVLRTSSESRPSDSIVATATSTPPATEPKKETT